MQLFIINYQGTSWLWLYGSWIYNYLCNQCLSLLTLWVWIPLMVRCTNTTLCDKVCHWLAAGMWFSSGTHVSSTNKTDRHDIIEILLKVALNTITLTTYTKLCTKHTYPLARWINLFGMLFTIYIKKNN